MLKDLNDENVISEIKTLINGIDTIKEEVNIYCDLMKQMLLSNSNSN